MSAALSLVASATPEGESTAGRRRVARAMWIGLWVWPSFALLDLYMCYVAYPGAPFRAFLGYRVVVELAFYLVYRRSRDARTELTRLFWWQNLCYGSAALFIAVMAVDLGGIRSPYMHGISIVALVRAALVPTHWRRGVATYARIAFAFPLVIGVGAVISPAAREEWLSTESLIVFASNFVFVLTSSFLGLVTGHIVWRAEEQLYRARRIGRYRLQAPIGKGGMGEVWLAWDERLHRDVALKILRVHNARGPEAVRRFELEAQAAGQLRGPHVVHIFDFGASDDGLYYIAMEYLTGMSLDTLVERFGPLPPARATALIMQACLALEEAHASGIIHRDLKPHNLFLTRTPDGRDLLKLLDFGVARLHSDEAPDERITWTGTMVGTPAYLAPELWRGAEADERSDVYALGATLHFLLTGRAPFEGWTLSQLRAAHLSGVAPATLLDVAAERGALSAVVLRCLSPSREHRLRSARAMHDALAELHDAGAWTPDDVDAFWRSVERRRSGAFTTAPDRAAGSGVLAPSS